MFHGFKDHLMLKAKKYTTTLAYLGYMMCFVSYICGKPGFVSQIEEKILKNRFSTSYDETYMV